MSDLTANAATYRTKNYKVQGYIGTLPQTIVHNGTLSATPTFPAQTIAITTSGGSAASVKRGMTVRIETSGGVLKGYCRVASSGTISATSLPINETSKGVVNLASGDIFKIYDGFRIWDMLVSATAALNKDSRIAYSDQGSNPDPIANAGGGFFGFVDDGQVYATVSFPGTSSLNVDPDSASKTYLWAVGDGTITVGTTTTGDITATFPVGFRHVQLITTDANGKATTRQFPVQVYNRSTTRPLSVSNATLTYSHEDGHSLTFDLPKNSESGISTLPDGALVCFFVDEYYGDTRVSYGSNVSGRSHMKFLGHLVRDTPHIDTSNKTVTFEAVSPLGMLNRTPALPQLMVQSTSGTLWRHVKTLNTNRMVWYLTRYGSTLMNNFDFVWQITGSALTYRRIAVTETSSIGGQLRDIAQSVNLLVTCDRLGRILFIQDYVYLSSANRAARTVVFNFTTADIRSSFEPSVEHRGTVKFVRGEGITDGTSAGSNKPCFSNSPGNAPSPFGTGTDTLARQIVDDQTDINARTGYHFAALNGLYDGQFVPQGVTLRATGGYGWWDLAYNEPITITLSATDNPRGRAYTTSVKWLGSASSITYDGENGTADTTYTISHETTGQPGTTYVKPQRSQNGLPSFPPINLSMPAPILPPTDTPLASGTSNMAMFFLADSTFSLTNSFNNPPGAGGPTWTGTSPGTINGSFQSVVADPFSPLYLGTGTTVNGWLATTTRLYRLTDIFNAAGTRAATLQFTFPFTVSTNLPYRILATERAVQNFVICISYYNSSNGLYVTRTTDGGTNWTDTQLTANFNSATDVNPVAWVSGKTAGVAYTTAFTSSSGNSSTTALYKTVNYGANWSAVSGFSNTRELGRCLHMPWPVTPTDAERYLYYSKIVTGPEYRLTRLDMTLGTETDIAPTIYTDTAGLWANPFSLDTSVLDLNSMAVIGVDFSTADTALYTTRNAMSATPTWAQRTTPGAFPGRAQGVRFAPNSSTMLYVMGSQSNMINISNNYGALLENYTGSASGQTYPIAIIGG